jgi:predicted SnoaL-like aldol condensation-catalyzing enzyme
VVASYTAAVHADAGVDSLAPVLTPAVLHRPSSALGVTPVIEALQQTHRPGSVTLAVVINDDRAAILHTELTADGERFEGLDVLSMDDTGIVEIAQYGSAANGTAADATPVSISRTAATPEPAAEAAAIALVKRFYQEVFGLSDPAAVDRLVTQDYIQHNPWIGQGRAGLRALVERSGPAPMDGLGAGGCFAAADFVVHISHLPVGDGFTLVDLFRVEGSLLAEHWDFTPLGTTLPAPPGADL